MKALIEADAKLTEDVKGGYALHALFKRENHELMREKKFFDPTT